MNQEQMSNALDAGFEGWCAEQRRRGYFAALKVTGEQLELAQMVMKMAYVQGHMDGGMMMVNPPSDLLKTGEGK